MKRNIISFLLLLCSIAQGSAAANPGRVDLQWIGNSPRIPVGVSWGVPFAEGEFKEGQPVVLSSDARGSIPVQTWVMARHRDGSVKWLGMGASMLPSDSTGLRLSFPRRADEEGGISVRESSDRIVVDNNVCEITFEKSSQRIISSIKHNGVTVAENGRLVCSLEKGDACSRTWQQFTGKVEKVSLEHKGKVRSVVKVEGVHMSEDGSRSWLPFTVRFYIYDGTDAIKMVHTIVYDGDQHKDFIKSLGVKFDIPLREQVHNRHVRLSGEGYGMWNEPVQPLFGRRQSVYEGEPMYERQVAGERIPQKEQFDEKNRFYMDNWAQWNDYSLYQPNPDGFTIRKRTNPESSWIGTAGGRRSTGFALAGDVSGGLGASLKDFWQSYPSEMEINGMCTDTATMSIWFWSPRSEAMDLRHYDTRGHDLEAAYEDYQEGMSTPYGIARTNVVMLYPYSKMPTIPQAADMASSIDDANQIMPTPRYLHDTGVFGVWSLPDYSTPTRSWIEKQISESFEFYKLTVDQQKWYGFWNYGDFMHSYNVGRHMWNYDVGGMAWDNTELASDLWLWYTFIRTGRADMFKMAEAMTRHTSEVDIYHIGEMAGLGSRHNVSHWGCGAKEARIGQAWSKRFYYYLTADDRVGDIMHDATAADFALLKYDPLRIAKPRDQFPSSQPTRLRWGPDWIAFAGSWFTEWERTGDEKWLRKIKRGMADLSRLPNGLYTGEGFLGYDPSTGDITYEGDPESVDTRGTLADIMGGFETMMELYPAMLDRDFNKAYLTYAKFYNIPADHPMRSLPENEPYKKWYCRGKLPRICGFAARELDDDQLARLAWELFFSDCRDADGNITDMFGSQVLEGPYVIGTMNENVKIHTNNVSQWNLNAIMMLELLPDEMPEVL